MVIAFAHPLGWIMSAEGMPASLSSRDSTNQSSSRESTSQSSSRETTSQSSSGETWVSELEGIAAKLDRLSPFAAEVEYEATLPMAADPVVYSATVASVNGGGRSDLFPASYLIEWTLPIPEVDGGSTSGFTAYFDGNLYRLANQRLSEYHMEWDSIPFLSPRGGVQETGQFIDLLPASLARQLRRFAADDSYRLRPVKRSTFSGTEALTITGEENIKGQTAREFSLVFDAATGSPLRLHYEMNPGQISETTITATYHYPADLEVPTDEQTLIARYPEAFERFRQSNFRIENMRGEMLPGFALPTLTAERYSRGAGDPFPSPTVVAILDPEVDTNSRTIEAIRQGATQAPRQVNIIWAFTGNHIDTIEPQVADAAYPENETTLISARSLARDCGTNVFPTILIVEPSGKIANVILGFNNSLASDVIQSVAVMR